jgi:hypothetical protein
MTSIQRFCWQYSRLSITPPGSGVRIVLLDVENMSGQKKCDWEIGTGLDHSGGWTNIKLESTQDGLGTHLQRAKKEGTARHYKERHQQNQRAHRWRHEADQADRAGGGNWIQLDGDLGGRPSKAAEMGSLDTGRQQNTSQTCECNTAEPLRRSSSEVQSFRHRFKLGCNRATTEWTPGYRIWLILALRGLKPSLNRMYPQVLFALQ